MKKAFLAFAAAATSLALVPSANAAVTVSPPDRSADGSFTQTFSSTLVQGAFTETVNFDVLVQAFGNLTVSTLAVTDGGPNDVDFTSILLSGGTLSGSVPFVPLMGEPDEQRGLRNITLGAGTYTITVNGNALGANGGYRGQVSFQAVPEPATWGMMILGFLGMGYAMRRRSTQARVRFV